MTARNASRERSPLIYLAIAGLVLAAALAPRLLGEVERQALIAEVDPHFAAIDQAIDRYWQGAFPEQFPGAQRRYSRPSLRYFQPSVEPVHDRFLRKSVAYYDTESRQMRVNLDRLEDVSPFVLAHEYGHHIQNLTGGFGLFEARVLALAPEENEIESRISTRIELQAECLAGVWAHHAEGVVAGVDRESVRAELAGLSFERMSATHGSGRQRVAWFARGYALGRAADCDTVSPDWDRL